MKRSKYVEFFHINTLFLSCDEFYTAHLAASTCQSTSVSLGRCRSNEVNAHWNSSRVVTFGSQLYVTFGKFIEDREGKGDLPLNNRCWSRFIAMPLFIVGSLRKRQSKRGSFELSKSLNLDARASPPIAQFKKTENVFYVIAWRYSTYNWVIYFLRRWCNFLNAILISPL